MRYGPGNNRCSDTRHMLLLSVRKRLLFKALEARQGLRKARHREVEAVHFAVRIMFSGLDLFLIYMYLQLSGTGMSNIRVAIPDI